MVAILAVSGVLVSALFTHPSTIKYVATVAGSVLLVLVATVRAPFRLLVGLAIVVAPFDLVKSVGSVQVTPLLAVDALALLVWLPRSRVQGSAALRPMVVLFPLLLVPALVGSDGVANWVVWLAVTVVTACLAFIVAREPGGPTFIATMVAVSALIQGGLAIWEHKSGHRLDLYQTGTASYGGEYFFSYGSYDRPPGALPDPIGLGQVLALCIPLMVALAVSLRRWQLSIAVLGATAIAAIGLLLSLSRMSIVATAAGLVVTVLLLPRKALLRRGLSVAGMVALVAILGLALGGRTLSQRLDSILHPTAASVSTAPGDLTRARIWGAALKTAEAHTVAGVGFGNIAKDLPKHGVSLASQAHAHNTYLQFFAEGGALGLIALLGVLVAGAIDLARGFAKNRVWVAGAAGAFVATIISWLTDVEVRYLQVSAMVAVLLGLIAALGIRERRPSKALARPPSSAVDERRPSLHDPLAT